MEVLFCQCLARFIARIPKVIILRSSFFGYLLSEKFQQNVNLVNRLSHSSIYLVVLFPPKKSAPCTRVRKDRNWREKRGTRSSLPTAMSAVVEQALVLS